MTAADRVVVVVGPPLSGVSAVIAGLHMKLPEVTLVEADALALERAPDAVLAVVSAVAPVTRSDWTLVEQAAGRSNLVVGVVSKTDAHRGWRDVMEADRTLVAGWDERAAGMSWVGVAAAPDLGDPRLDELVVLLRERFADPDLHRRSQLWSIPCRPRSEQVRRRPPIPAAPGAVVMKSVLQRTRLRLLRFVRDRCSALRGELRDIAAAVPVGGSADFEALVLVKVDRFVLDLDEEVDRAVDVAAATLRLDRRAAIRAELAMRDGPPDVSRSAASSRGLEGRLMAVLGVGFGLGIALAASRLLAGVAPGLSVAGLAAGAAAGLTLMVWVVRARGLLHERALLDRWVAEVAAALRWHGEAVIAERLLAAESAWAQLDSGRASATNSVDPRWTREYVTDQYDW
ncbi:hypothetical protein [Mycolicibacterium hodleri]|uniref:Uncharacterized protein n=1 Tax=Mycolicibacterium hodleri TaxID=49897 RepID=A0A502DJ19_9MYCO|nr:hypothetical protein [Mycolicibacterium hodleri]TPG25507.1 hypothetical protein EAH80_30310 [Mycolicibacterium hodleri]